MRTINLFIGGALLLGILGIVWVCGSVIACWTFVKSQIEIDHAPARVWWT